MISGIIIGGALGIAVYSALVEPQWIRLVEYHIEIKGLPESFDKFRLLQLSDLHGRVEVFSLPMWKKWVDETDLVIVTGDLYSAFTLPRRRLARALTDLVRHRNVLYVSGNHDYHGGRLNVAPWDASSVLLDNRAHYIGHDDGGIWIGGLPDLIKGRPEMSSLLQRLESHPQAPAILLSHRPDAINLPGIERFQLVISGHTHGGQIIIPGWGAPVRHNDLPNRYVAGHGYFNKTHVITSRGLGTSELPMRFFSRPELVRITLHRQRKD